MKAEKVWTCHIGHYHQVGCLHEERKLFEKKERALDQAEILPMGCSQWASHGRKYKYWQYFAKEIRADFITELQAASKQIHGGGNGRRILAELIEKLKKL